MSFGWTNKEKEKYFAKAEKMIEKAELQGVIKIDRERFAIKENKIIKVYVKKMDIRGNKKAWWKAKREIKGFKDEPVQRDCMGKKMKQLFLKGYIEMRIGGEQ